MNQQEANVWTRNGTDLYIYTYAGKNLQDSTYTSQSLIDAKHAVGSVFKRENRLLAAATTTEIVEFHVHWQNRRILHPIPPANCPPRIHAPQRQRIATAANAASHKRNHCRPRIQDQFRSHIRERNQVRQNGFVRKGRNKMFEPLIAAHPAACGPLEQPHQFNVASTEPPSMLSTPIDGLMKSLR